MSHITHINTIMCTFHTIYFNMNKWAFRHIFLLNKPTNKFKMLGGFRPKNIKLEERIPFCPFNLQVR
jgi:hypothetical protein